MHFAYANLRFSLFLALLGCAASAWGCNRPSSQGAQQTEPGPMRVGPENTVTVRREIIRTGPRLSGTLEPKRQARVRAEVAGSVTWVGAELGQRVKQGKVLVRIEHGAIDKSVASLRSALKSAELELENANRQLERAQTLFQSGALAQQDLEATQIARTAAESRVAQARAQLTQAEEQLASATVRAPMDGVVSEKEVNQGDVVALGAPLFTVIDPSSMRLEASIPSEALPALEEGAQVDFELRGFPGRTFQGRIAQIAPAVDPQTRQITTLVEIPNPGGELLAGLFAEGRIGAQSKETLVVPIAAIDQTGTEPAVVAIRGGKTARIPVTLGLEDPQTERVEILGPLTEGDVLLTGAAKAVAPGTAVTLHAAREATAPAAVTQSTQATSR